MFPTFVCLLSLFSNFFLPWFCCTATHRTPIISFFLSFLSLSPPTPFLSPFFSESSLHFPSVLQSWKFYLQQQQQTPRPGSTLLRPPNSIPSTQMHHRLMYFDSLLLDWRSSRLWKALPHQVWTGFSFSLQFSPKTKTETEKKKNLFLPGTGVLAPWHLVSKTGSRSWKKRGVHRRNLQKERKKSKAGKERDKRLRIVSVGFFFLLVLVVALGGVCFSFWDPLEILLFFFLHLHFWSMFTPMVCVCLFFCVFLFTTCCLFFFFWLLQLRRVR